MNHKLFSVILITFFLSACVGTQSMLLEEQPLEGLTITIDAGHGNSRDYDTFRQGPSGEREEWINLRVAKILARKLNLAGAQVLMTRTKDQDVSLGGRAALAKKHGSDLFVSIHHNGSKNDPGMDMPMVYFFGDAEMNPASVDFAKILLDSMRAEMTFQQPEAGAIYSDHLIYHAGTSVLRNTFDHMPGVIGEAGFFTHPAGEDRLKDKDYNQLEADVYYKAILDYYERGLPFATPLVADSLAYLDLTRSIGFDLDDGFGNTFFEENSFKVLQDGKRIPSSYNSNTGVLTAQPDSAHGKHVTFQVFARNLTGNAMHPKPFTFLTQTGFEWYSHQTWQDAYLAADKQYHVFETSRDLTALESALNLYKLSLELQIVHPEARTTEERILELFKQKQELQDVDLHDEISRQETRILNYYPGD